MKSKTFKTLDEQIEIFRNKGLIINDVDKTKNILLRENYFFVSGYRHLFLDPKNNRNYLVGTNFEELYAMFTFDRKIRNIVFKNLLIIENNVKSIFSYQLSKKYGYREKDYLKASSFTNNPEKINQINDLLKKMKRQIRVNGSQHSATQHYINNYGYIPMWVVVRVLSFGIVSELYTIMKDEDQSAIANIYGTSIENLEIYLPILANYRNLCAHEDILYNHRTQKTIFDTRYHIQLRISKEDGEYIYGKNDLFALIIIMKTLLREEEFRLLISEISYEVDFLSGKLNTINIEKVLHKIGFPINFKDLSDL